MKMKCIATVFLLLGLLLFGNRSFAQKNASLYKDILEDGNIKKSYWQAKNNTSEVEVAFSGLFLFYKTFLSSQDLTVCTFTPSCSEYGILAIKEHGVAKGGLMTIDRLTRCNGLSAEKYEFDTQLMLLKDDPRNHNHVPIVSTYK